MFMPSYEIEELIHEEFLMAFDEFERAPAAGKAGAAVRLNFAVRRLYDFVGYGKPPATSRLRA